MKTKIDERIKGRETRITGNFEIWVGDNKIAEGKNRFTRYLMSSIVAIITNRECKGTCYETLYTRGLSYGATARVGKDTTTPTTTTMGDLVDKIDIAPSSVTRKLWRLEAEWKYMAEFLFKWNAEVLPSETIGEFGVWLYLDSDDWSSPLLNANRCCAGCTLAPVGSPGTRLASRIASADGKFTEFYYDNSEPLTYIWRLVVQIK